MSMHTLRAEPNNLACNKLVPTKSGFEIEIWLRSISTQQTLCKREFKENKSKKKCGDGGQSQSRRRLKRMRLQ
uniref:Uncharacterized protein n=1 Tax=Rhizophora mucronata TaxID=61149 RepID=A0A2P2QKF8_RHIMU